MTDAAAGATGPELLDLLRDVPLLDGVAPDALAEIARTASLERIQGGETLMREGEPSDSLYILIQGRLRATSTGFDGQTRVLGEIRRGDAVGEMGVLTGAPRAATILAVRDSLLLRLPVDPSRNAVVENAALVLAMAKVVVKRAAGMIAQPKPQDGGVVLALVSAGCSGSHLAEAASRLSEALAACTPVASIGGRAAAERIGRPVDEAASGELIGWLSELEGQVATIVLEADADDTPWTRFCRRQADRLILVVEGSATPGATPQRVGTRAVCDLLVLHDEGPPRGGAALKAVWPEARDIWHVVRGGEGDWRRVARLLTGRATGLVLSGGGARGFAHLGVLRALEEMDQPVDVLGGTSFGAVVAALVAMGLGWRDIYALFIEVFVKHPPQRDYTFPLVAIATGRRLTKALVRLFGATEIEDLRLPFFCMTTNLSRAVSVEHTSGPLTRWVRASLSLPGLAPPVIHDGEVFVDGCLFNNLPIDVMARRWPSSIIGVDVAQEVELTTTAPHRDVVSGWGLMLRNLSPFGARYDGPTFPLLLQRAAMVGSAQAVERVRSSAAVYLRPAVGTCNVLDWGRHAVMLEAGYDCARAALPAWAAARAEAG